MIDMKPFSSYLTSKYLKSSDIPHPVRVTIEYLQEETINEDTKLVLYFVGKKLGLALGATNIIELRNAFGDDPQNCVGKQIELYTTPTTYKGQPTRGLRVRPIASQGHATPPSTQPQETYPSGPHHPVEEEEIPF